MLTPGEFRRDLAVQHVLANLRRVARERIAVPAASGLLMEDDLLPGELRANLLGISVSLWPGLSTLRVARAGRPPSSP